MTSIPPSAQTCPIGPNESDNCVLLAHGEGGKLMRDFIRDRIVPRFKNDFLNSLDDATRLPGIDGQIAFSTDSYVVTPLFFPGGDIGSLAVYGTVNDLATTGARPMWLTLSLIVEEGFSLEILDRVLNQVATAAKETGLLVVAGDTKVVPRGAADQLFLNTAGIGQMMEPAPPGPSAIQAGDALLVSGSIGKHGVAVLAKRNELAFQPEPRSDSAPLNQTVAALLSELPGSIRCLRDATRGGVSAVLHEWAEASHLTMSLDEALIPVSPEIRGACELLGLEPLHIANEGTMVICLEPDAVDTALETLRTFENHRHAACIGEAIPQRVAPVAIRRLWGNLQAVDDPPGAPLPRIC